ncbi:MAG: hypothetical protein ACRDOU_04175 [Streptosporangiaceae bacterium]
MSQRSRPGGGKDRGANGGWARGRPLSPADLAAKPSDPEPQGPVGDAAPAVSSPRGGLDLASALTAEWAPTLGRVLLGLVLFWFGYHELLLPGEWTGYVPVISETSSLAIILVLAHGWVLLVLSAALLGGVVPRAAAAIASLLLLEIVISLAVTGLSDTALRDVGVLGLAICLTGCRNQRFVLRT